MKTLVNLPLLLMVAALSVSVGCTKKRSPKLADGAGRYMESVSTYNNQVYAVDTLGPITDSKGNDLKLGQSLERQTDATQFGLQTLPMVNFKTEAKLPTGTRFYAVPQTQNRYWIEYELTNDFLVLHKVAKIEDLPVDEKTLASPSKTKQGLVRVPLIGYPILAKVVREVVKNDLGEKTSRLDERSVPNIENAQYVQIDFNRPTEFGKLDKKDVLPVDYLSGDWYFGQTIVGAPDVLSMWVSSGTTTQMTGFERGYIAPNQSIIRFNRTEKNIQVLGLVVPERAHLNERNLPQLATFPATAVSYQVKKVGNSTAFSEEENRDIPWQKAPYIKIDWSQASAAFLGAFISPSVGSEVFDNPKLVLTQVQDNYLSLTYELSGSNARVQLSFWRTSEFKKISPNYEPRIHFEQDWNKFGFFTVNKPEVIEGYKYRTQSDYDKIRYMVRYNPKMKKIVYHLSESAPDWVLEPSRRSVEEWNKAFAAAETGMTIELNEKKVSTGDIRYNVLNFIGNESTAGGGYYGIASMIVNPFSGEIVSGRANIWHENFMRTATSEVNAYFLSKAGEIPDVYASGLGGLDERISLATKSFVSLLTKEEKNLPVQEIAEKLTGKPLTRNEVLKNSTLPFKQALDFRKRTTRNSRLFDAQALAVPNVSKDIDVYCKDLNGEIEKYKASKDQSIRTNAVEKCAREVAKILMVPTIIHEMGHALGLRHNFRGSVDKANWLSPQENGTAYPSYSSSVMEYSDGDEDRMQKAGYYDIAAIRFGYAGKVALENGTKLGQPVAIDVTKTIDENMQGKKQKKYMFCTDEHVEENRDDLCARWDSGTTPLEIVNFHIKAMNQSFLISQERLGRLQVPTQYSAFYRFEMHMLPLLKIYSAWRLNLLKYTGGKEKYLESLDGEEFKKLLTLMSKDPVYGPIYSQYRPAVEKMYSFFANIAMLPDRYCVFQDTNAKQLNLVEFTKVRDEINRRSGQVAYKCNSEEAKPFFKRVGGTSIAEFGYHVNDFRYDMSVDQTDKPIDVAGMYLTRVFASYSLGIRGYQLKDSYVSEFYPNMMDEPDFREWWMSTIINRALKGLNSDLLDRNPELKNSLKGISLKSSKEFYPLFKNERDLIGIQASYMKNSLWIPSNIPASLERMKKIGGSLSTSGSGSVDVEGGLSFTPTSDAVYSKQVIKRYVELKILKNLKFQLFSEILKTISQFKKLETDDGLKTLKASEVADFADRILANIRDVAATTKQETVVHATEFDTLFPELGDVFESGVNINKKAEAIEDKDKKEEYLNKTVLELAPDFKTVNVTELVQKVEQKVLEYQSNTEEYEAQSHVLLTVLLLNLTND